MDFFSKKVEKKIKSRKFVEIRFLVIAPLVMIQSVILNMVNVHQVITYLKLCRVWL
jgi:hypothetical protein